MSKWVFSPYYEMNVFFKFSQGTKSSQPAPRGLQYDNSIYPNNNTEQGNSDSAYAGGYSRGGGAPPTQQQQPPSSTQVYRPPHMQNRMNMPK